MNIYLCFGHNVKPTKIFHEKGLQEDFSLRPVTQILLLLLLFPSLFIIFLENSC